MDGSEDHDRTETVAGREADQPVLPGGLSAVDLLRAHLGECGPEADSKQVGERLEVLRSLLSSVHELFSQQAAATNEEPDPSRTEDKLDDLVLRFLSGAVSREARYEVGDELARGGQGIIHKAWDRDLHRSVAVKSLRGTSPGSSTASRAHSRSLGRFLDEALVTGQLDHPGIVPLHELGVDANGQMLFTMKLVRGEDLSEVVEAKDGFGEAGSLQRVLDIMVKVCDAVGYAHSKGVVHRDLKPANIRIGRFGEVYVMDWGLARVAGRPSADIRVRLPVEESVDVQSVRQRESPGIAEDSPLITMNGDVIGTPAYMAPEQAAGELDEIDECSDVYAMGAILYALLAGHSPFVKPGTVLNNYAVWARVQEGPPEPLSEIAPDANPEVVAICEKAMSRRKPDRYPTAAELAKDIRAFLDGRVVQAYRTGAFAELKKWTLRNRGVAAMIAALFLFVLVAGGLFNRQLSERANDAEQANLLKRRLLDEALAQSLLLDVDVIYPVHPDTVPELEEWLTGARDLISREELYAEQLNQLEAQLLADGASKTLTPSAHSDYERLLITQRQHRQIEWAVEGAAERLIAEPEHVNSLDVMRVLAPRVEPLAGEIETLEARVSEWANWSFETDEAERAHSRLFTLVAGLGRFSSAEGAIGQMERRLQRARVLSELSDDDRDKWDEAIASIEESPIYSGLKLSPQVGLLPLGPGFTTGLWEFQHTLSGEAPEFNSSGTYSVAPETGIVLVLLPGRTISIGSQNTSPSDDYYLPIGEPSERPVREVELAPFFLSKYEMTQAQWFRVSGEKPSEHVEGTHAPFVWVSSTHPVEQVNWFDCVEMLGRWNLILPTEAQFEYAAKGHGEPITLPRETRLTRSVFFGSRWNNGKPMHAPVDIFEPNTLGFYHTEGNVSEWVQDWHHGSYANVSFREGDGLVLMDGEPVVDVLEVKTQRGATYKNDITEMRPTRRWSRAPASSDDDLGVRPALMIAP